ncbi:MAG: hypothetical protein ACOCVN_01495, partial [bacterium]
MVSNKLHVEFINKKRSLDEIGTVLKSEFVGLDEIIDNIIANISSWYLLPDFQDKPVIINLWGLTGVGKTSLINRLVALLNYEDRYYKIDLGDKSSDSSFQSTMDDLCDHEDSTPLIIALDEFQHSRTVDELGSELSLDKNRVIWELIDSGKITHKDYDFELFSFSNVIEKLKRLTYNDIEIKNGKVIKGLELYKKELDITDKDGESLWFVPEEYHRMILTYADEKYNLKLIHDIEKLLQILNKHETISFLIQVYRNAIKPGIRNFSHSLIFILGNLDEAYGMCHTLSTDIDADEFHEMSLKISMPDIKHALQKRFRNEQIARLGNIHIIYPAFSSLSYKQFIRLELAKVISKIKKQYFLDIKFEHSVESFIYDEAVFPVQGMRPVLTSIHQIIVSKLSNFLTEYYLHVPDADSIVFEIRSNQLKGNYYKSDVPVHEFTVPVTTNLAQIRKSTFDDKQAITAVHEAGHAVLSALLLNTIPEVIYSKTTDAGAEGFVYTKIKWEFISKKSIVPRAAMMLGGFIAEKIVFGEENVTSGAEGDIQKATEFLGTMFKKSGMGSIQGNFSIKSTASDNLLHKYDFLEEEIKSAIRKAVSLA